MKSIRVTVRDYDPNTNLYLVKDEAECDEFCVMLKANMLLMNPNYLVGKDIEIVRVYPAFYHATLVEIYEEVQDGA